MKLHVSQKTKILFSIPSLIICGFIIGLMFSHFFLRTRDVRISLPIAHSINTQGPHSCKTLLYTFLTGNNENIGRNKVVAQISQSTLNNQVTINLQGNSLFIKDGRSSEENIPWAIATNSADFLIASSVNTRETFKYNMHSTFILDKNTGYATFSRTGSGMFTTTALNSESSFLFCL